MVRCGLLILRMHRALTVNVAPVQHPHLDGAAVATIQQHMAQQAALSQVPDVVKTVSFLIFFLDVH